MVAVSMVKTTIDIPDELWKKFSIKVIEDYGGRKKNDIIQSLIQFFLGSHYFVTCKKCSKEIDLTNLEAKGGVKLDFWGSLREDKPEGIRFNVSCPFCKEGQTFRLQEVSPTYEDLKK